MSNIEPTKSTALNTLFEIAGSKSNGTSNQRFFEPPRTAVAFAEYLGQSDPRNLDERVNRNFIRELGSNASPQERLFADLIYGGGGFKSSPTLGTALPAYERALVLYDQLTSAAQLRNTLSPFDDPDNVGLLLNLADLVTEDEGVLFNGNIVPASSFDVLANASGDGDTTISVADLRAIINDNTGLYTNADVALAQRLFDNPEFFRTLAGETNPDLPLAEVTLSYESIANFIDKNLSIPTPPKGTKEQDDREGYFANLNTILTRINNGELNPLESTSGVKYWDYNSQSNSVTLDNGWRVDFVLLSGNSIDVEVYDAEGNKVAIGDQIAFTDSQGNDLGKDFDVNQDTNFTMHLDDNTKITFQNNAEGRVKNLTITNSATGESLRAVDLDTADKVTVGQNLFHQKNAAEDDQFLADGINFNNSGSAVDWVFADGGDFSEDPVNSSSALNSGIWTLEYNDSYKLPPQELVSQDAFDVFILAFLNKNFETLDLDKDGVLTYQELNTIQSSNATPEFVKEIIGGLLTNAGSTEGSVGLIDRLNSNPLANRISQIEIRHGNDSDEADDTVAGRTILSELKNFSDFEKLLWQEQSTLLLQGPAFTDQAKRVSAISIISENFAALSGDDGKLTEAELQAWANNTNIPAYIREAIQNVLAKNGLFDELAIAGDPPYLINEPVDESKATERELIRVVGNSPALITVNHHSSKDDPIEQLDVALGILGSASNALKLGEKDEWTIQDLDIIANDESIPENVRDAAALVSKYLREEGTSSNSAISNILAEIDKGPQYSGYETANNALNLHQLPGNSKPKPTPPPVAFVEPVVEELIDDDLIDDIEKVFSNYQYASTYGIPWGDVLEVLEAEQWKAEDIAEVEKIFYQYSTSFSSSNGIERNHIFYTLFGDPSTGHTGFLDHLRGIQDKVTREAGVSDWSWP